MKLAIVDYDMGNVHSLKAALLCVAPGANVVVSNRAEELFSANLLFLPGVGHFKQAMIKLEEYGLIGLLKDLVLKEKRPLFGICLGMQLLFESSSEGDITPGLGLFEAEVREIPKGPNKVPHMGFNSVITPKEGRMFKHIETPDFYFVHSYCVHDIAMHGTCKAYCDYNTLFVAAVEKDHVWGTQFHPEKSQNNGLLLIKNFISAYAH